MSAPDLRTLFGRAAIDLGTRGLAKGDYVGRPMRRNKPNTVDIRQALMNATAPGYVFANAPYAHRVAYWRAIRLFTAEVGQGPAAWGDRPDVNTSRAVDALTTLRDRFAEVAA